MTSICQIRPGVPEEIKGIEWICFGSTVFSAFLPLYANTPSLPAYLTKVGLEPSTENFYWASRMIGALADPWFSYCAQDIERYHDAVAVKGRRLIREYDQSMIGSGDFSKTAEADRKLCEMAKEETDTVLGKVLQTASEHMKNGYSLADN